MATALISLTTMFVCYLLFFVSFSRSLPSHPNIAQAVAMDDRDTDKLVVLYELANGGDFSTYAWGNESVSMGVLMR